jgi:sodium pump decarboxylase gamma subunit
MSVTELLKQFADPGVMHSLSMMDKLVAGLVTTLLGMGITFTALIVLQLVISWMDRLINGPTVDRAGTPETAPAAEPAAARETNDRDDHELVAVLTAAIAMKMKTSVGNIVIRNIEKVEDRSPAWNRAGIIEQMNSRF